MNPLEAARMFAMNVGPCSPVYHLAVAICMVRQVDPMSWSMGGGVPNWQAVIVETVLLENMRRLLP